MAKTGDVAPDVKASDLFPHMALPSKWKGWRRFLRPFTIQGPRNKLHYTTKSRLALVKSRWALLTDQQRTDWATWAAAHHPDDGIWAAPFAWTGQLAHAFSNMRLLFIGRSLRDDAPTAAVPLSPALEEYGWVIQPGLNRIFIKWLDVGSDDLTVLVSIRMYSAHSGLKTWLYTIPIAHVDRPTRSYGIDEPTGERMWFSLVEVHNGQGIAGPPCVYWVDRGVW